MSDLFPNEGPIPPEPRPLHEWASYDPHTDTVTIYDIKYSRELLRHFAVSEPGITFKIVERHAGGITISQERSDLEAAAPDMLAALQAALPIMLEDMKGGYERDDGKDAAAVKAVRDAIAKATYPSQEDAA